jgi:hypothetical protein
MKYGIQRYLQLYVLHVQPICIIIFGGTPHCTIYCTLLMFPLSLGTVQILISTQAV